MSMRPLVGSKHSEFDWMNGDCYEPRPDLSPTLRRRRRAKVICAFLAIIAATCVLLYAISN